MVISRKKFRKFYYDFDDLKIVNKSGYVKHYLAEVEKRDEKSDLNVIKELKKLDNLFQTEDKNWSLLHQGWVIIRKHTFRIFLPNMLARQLFERDGKSKFLLSYNSLVDLGYCGYSGYYCAECWSTEDLRSRISKEVYIKLIDIDRALGSNENRLWLKFLTFSTFLFCSTSKSLLFDAIKFVVPFSILNAVFNWSTIQLGYMK